MTDFDKKMNEARKNFVCDVETKEPPEFKGLFACSASFKAGATWAKQELEGDVSYYKNKLEVSEAMQYGYKLKLDAALAEIERLKG